jgi:hypothetical protein
MGNDERAPSERREAGPRSHLFTVRLWKVEMAHRSEYRGSVRDVISGAFRNFRDWSDLAAFMIEWVEEDKPGQRGQREPTRYGKGKERP